jgi:hypothetical protein
MKAFGGVDAFLRILWLYSPLLGFSRSFHFLDPVHSRHDSLDGGSAERKASTDTQTPISPVLHAIPLFERAKTIHALDHAATSIDGVDV